jgi:hypothetical protein
MGKVLWHEFEIEIQIYTLSFSNVRPREIKKRPRPW